jgi:hypothetical protein
LYAMWSSMDLFVAAKTSIPVLLYTTEQICVAHFMVYLFRRWRRRSGTEKRDIEESVADGGADLDETNVETNNPPRHDSIHDDEVVDHAVPEKESLKSVTAAPPSGAT